MTPWPGADEHGSGSQWGRVNGGRTGPQRRHLLLLWHAQFFEFLHYVRSVIANVDSLLDVEDLPVLANEIGPTLRDLTVGMQDSQRLRCRLIRIAENRKIAIERFGELRVFLHRVSAGRKVGYVKLLQRRAAVTQRLALGRSATREGHRIPRNDDGFPLVPSAEMAQSRAIGLRQHRDSLLLAY